MSKLFTSSKEVENYHIELGHSDKFCIAPFTTLLLEPDGKVGACRHKGSEFPVGNILENSFEEIWNGAFIKNWRSEFLGGKPKICQSEVKDRKCNHCPDYNSIIDRTQIAIHQTKKPSRLAFNFNGHCNLECQMCHIWEKQNGLYDEIKFWDQLDFWIDDLQVVELLSGEPFIQKDTYKLIDLISEKKPDAMWTITTNANWLLNDYIKGKLDKINFNSLIISLDCVTSEFYSKIRKKGNLEKAINTMRALKSYEKERFERGLSPLNIKINFLFQRDNWKDLALIGKFSIDEEVSIFRTFLYEPADLSLLTLSELQRQDILDWYFSNMNVTDLKNSMRVIRPLLDSLTPINKAFFYDKFFQLLKVRVIEPTLVNL